MDWVEDFLKQRGIEAEKKKQLAVEREEARKALIRSLQPCPFCNNNEADLQTHTPTAMAGSIVKYAFVQCRDCMARGPKVADWMNEKGYKAKAVELWNNVHWS